MALLGTFIDVRTIASIAAQGTATFAHGISSAASQAGGTPDWCFAQGAATVASATNWFGFVTLLDATNVTVQNPGAASTPTANVVTVRAQSIIR